MSTGPAPATPTAGTRSGRNLLVVESALGAVTLVTLAGMARLFDGLGYLTVPAVVALAVHVISAYLRRTGRGLGLAALAGSAGAALLTAWMVLPGTTTFGIPGPATVAAAGRALAEAGAAFSKVVPPVPAGPGYVIATAAAAALVAFLSDWAAFRLRAGVEACVPSFAVFVFSGALAAGRGAVPAVLAYMAAVVVFVVLFRVGTERATAWFAGGVADGPLTMIRIGAITGAVAILAGVLVGPRLPGADDPPLVAYRGRDRQGRVSRAAVSPLVDVRGRLVEHSGIEVFTVESPEPRYWRLTSLDEFDGQLWSSNDTYKQARGRLRESVDSAGGTPLRQRFAIQGLGSIWLPAAYRPVRVVDGEGVSYNPDAASFITDEETADGEIYEIESSVPQLTANQLRAAPAGVPADLAERYLALPPIAPTIRQKAVELTRGSATPFDAALALQDFFRKEFTYDLDVRLGHDGRAMERFLFELRRGYCEQFAGAYATMARSIGLPARVAVGFTQGVLESDGRYHVKDEHAHAWPEVYIESFGWIAFEPTPGRGQPGSEGYTGVKPSQAASNQSEVATTLVPSTTVTTTAQAPQSTTIPRDEQVDSGGDTPEAEEEGSLGRRLLVALAVLVAAALAYAVGLPLFVRSHRRRRRAAATTPEQRVLVAWTEADEALALIRLGRRPAETLAEHGIRAGRSPALKGTPAPAALAALGRAATAASYSAGALADEVAGEADAHAATVEAQVRDGVSQTTRLRWALDPRPLLRSRRAGGPESAPVGPPRPTKAA